MLIVAVVVLFWKVLKVHRCCNCAATHFKFRPYLFDNIICTLFIIFLYVWLVNKESNEKVEI